MAVMKNNPRHTGLHKKTASKPNPLERALPQVKDFDYAEFRTIAGKAPFSQPEWASILHLSERTLQRYAKNNGHFSPIHAERALQMEKILKEGKRTFGSEEHFYNWLKGNPTMLEGRLTMDSLTTMDGIQMVMKQLKRIQEGLFA